jgi:hypothetical protein|tara:strand:+ start:411 stop:563 length:153 start_codon:yes stop_codon:yes gene_type:complete
MKETLIKTLNWKLEIVKRDNERIIKQVTANCKLQESYLKEILELVELIEE